MWGMLNFYKPQRTLVNILEVIYHASHCTPQIFLKIFLIKFHCLQIERHDWIRIYKISAVRFLLFTTRHSSPSPLSAVSLSVVSVTHSQLRSKNIKWKITEINLYVLNCPPS